MTTRWRIWVTTETLWQQDGGYVLLWKCYDNNKMADMCYYGNVMTTRWRIWVTTETLWQQDGGYVLLWKCYDNNKMADMCYYGKVMTTKNWQTSSVYDCTVEDVEYIYNKLSPYTELVIDVFYIFNSTVVDWTCLSIFLKREPMISWCEWQRIGTNLGENSTGR